jgi:6-phosphogluconolactonase/glucosamine-6-phosphate isomerase/deaminase
MHIIVAADPTLAGQEAARHVGRWLRAAADHGGSASVALSGGSAPLPMFAAMAVDDLPWPRIDVYQVDERVAPDGHGDRNVEALDVLPTAPGRLHPMPVTAADLAIAADRYAAELPATLDVVVLGVGDDGHTASWPPGDPVVDAPEPVAVVGPFNGRLRMTLTPGPVNGARHRLVLVTGGSKAAVVDRWLSGGGALPVERISREDTVMVLDAAAAAGAGVESSG